MKFTLLLCEFRDTVVTVTKMCNVNITMATLTGESLPCDLAVGSGFLEHPFPAGQVRGQVKMVDQTCLGRCHH